MSYTVHFNLVWKYVPELLNGAVLSFQIAILAFLGGMNYRFGGGVRQDFRGASSKGGRSGLCLLLHEHPQLVQIYFFFFALPQSGDPPDSLPSRAGRHDPECRSIFDRNPAGGFSVGSKIGIGGG